MKFSRHILFSAAIAANIAFSRPVKFAVNQVSFSQSGSDFSEALQRREVQSVLPTRLTSEQLAEIQPEFLERGLFSSRVGNAEVLQDLSDILDEYLTGRIDRATAELQLKQSMRKNGLEAELPEDIGTLRDFQSNERLRLIVDMNAGFARGYGDWIYNQNPVVLDQWPAQELFRAAPAKQPRNWIQRWGQAGGDIFNGRMIALRNGGIWTAISRFGVPYPPFDFNSHMRTRLVDRDTAMGLGLIDRDTQIAPQDRGFNDDLRFTPDVRDSALRQALEEDGYHFDGDVLTI